MELDTFLQRLQTAPDSIAFNETIAVVDALYDFTPTAFRNGELLNAAGQNNGSCKLFSFAQQHGLSPQQTLHCFGDYYRKDVLDHPDGTDHQNIRNFMRSGWDGIAFDGSALAAKRG
ncbi:MAG: type III effector [Sideroxydans sp.]|nr:type III effector [Sideroxydans sp.]